MRERQNRGHFNSTAVAISILYIHNVKNTKSVICIQNENSKENDMGDWLYVHNFHARINSRYEKPYNKPYYLPMIFFLGGGTPTSITRFRWCLVFGEALRGFVDKTEARLLPDSNRVQGKQQYILYKCTEAGITCTCTAV